MDEERPQHDTGVCDADFIDDFINEDSQECDIVHEDVYIRKKKKQGFRHWAEKSAGCRPAQR